MKIGDRKRARKMMQQLGWRMTTRAASRRKRMHEKRWQRRRQRQTRSKLALGMRTKAIANNDEAWAPRSSSFSVMVAYGETARTRATASMRAANSGAAVDIAPKRTTTQTRPHRQPLGPNGSRNLAANIASSSCTQTSDGGTLAQVHRRRTTRRLASASDEIETEAGDEAIRSQAHANIARKRIARAQADISPPKARSTFSIDCRRPKRAYLLPKRIDEANGQQNQFGLAQLDTNLDKNKRVKREPDVGIDTDRAIKIRSNSYLLRNIRTVIDRRQAGLLSPTSQSDTSQRRNNPTIDACLGKLRPPVCRLKSMPASANQNATQTNNRSAVVRRGVGCAGPGAAGSGGGVLVSVLGVVRHRANLVRPFRSACNSMLASGGGSSRPVSTGSRHYLTRQRMAQANHMAQAASGAISAQDAADRAQDNPISSMSRLGLHQQDQFNEMDQIKASSRSHQWYWSETDKSHECVVSKDRLSLCFHPHCSESAAACRSAEPLKRNGNYYYWEIHVQDKIYGTSVMFGLCTKQQRLHLNEYCNIVGLDKCGWSLSHKGLAWHNGSSAQYTSSFPANQPITIGLLYNTMRGELSYFMNGKNLGVAFRGLNDIQAELYPVVASTAKCTQMTLVGSYCGYVSLLERSCFTLLKSVANDRYELIEYLRQQDVPKHLLQYVAQAANVDCKSEAGLKSTVKQVDANNRSNALIRTWDSNQK